MSKEEKPQLPPGVIDEEAYWEYEKLKNHPILTTKRTHFASDGTEVYLGLFPHAIQKIIDHLPLAEQEKIMNLKTIFFKINNTMSAKRRTAFGFSLRGGKANKNAVEVSNRDAEIVEMFGRMFSVAEVYKVVNKDWGLDIPEATIRSFRISHQDEIQKLQDKFKASYADIRLGYKRSRLEELVWMFGRSKEKFIEKNEGREEYKLMLATLEQIRKEAEGDRLTIDGRVDVNYESNIQLHLREEVFKTLNIKEIILGRVAARMNLKSEKLIHSLNNSFYARFSNVLGNLKENDSTALTYPSQMNYDFERIRKDQPKLDQEFEEAVIIEETKGKKDMTRAEEIKQKMLERLKKNEDQVDKMKTVIGSMNDTTKNKNSSMRDYKPENAAGRPKTKK